MKLREARILVVDDSRELCSLVESICEQEGFSHVETAFSCREAEERIENGAADFLILDVNMPFEDGFSFFQRIKTVLEKQRIPVLFLSARDQDEDRLQGLDLGADDYLTKPFGTAELLARIRTALRHSQRATGTQSLKYEVGNLLIDFERRLVKVKGQDVHLTQIEYKLVSLLAQNAGRVMTYESIISKIWGPFADSDNQILRVNMAHIRRKLEENPAEPQYIFTEIGVGYRMREE